MVLLDSTLFRTGASLPPFRLMEPKTGACFSNDQFTDKALLIVMMCNHCPYVMRIKAALPKLAQELSEKDVAMLGVSSNDPVKYPEDHPEKMAQDAVHFGYSFPYLFDEDQSFATALQAVCTPEFFLFDRAHSLMYRGQMDGARPGNQAPNDGLDILAAVEAMQSGSAPIEPQHPSRGCSIKWRAGNEPAYVSRH